MDASRIFLIVMLKRRRRAPLLDIVPSLVVGLLGIAAVGVASAHSSSRSGRIEGRVTFQGTQPAPQTVGETGDVQPRLHVDPSGGLRFAVVYLPDGQRNTAAPPMPAVMNQRNFVFEPQVLAVRAGRPVRFTSDDVANHNVRARGPTPANTFFISTGPGSIGSTIHAFGVTPAGQPVALSCDIHSWMAAWVYVFDHDAFAVTGADGEFHIENVPAGRHRLAVRQPAGPLARDLSVDVVEGTTRVDVRFTDAEIATPAR